MGEHKSLFSRNPELHVESVRHFISCIVFADLQPVGFGQSVGTSRKSGCNSGAGGRMQRQQLHSVIETSVTRDGRGTLQMGNILEYMCTPIHMFMQAFKGKDFKGLRCHEIYPGHLTNLKWLISNF